MEHSTTPDKPGSRALASIDELLDALDDPYWSVFDAEPSGPDFDAEVALERRLAGR